MTSKLISLFVLLIAGSINAFSQISEDKKKQIEDQYHMVYWHTLEEDGYIEVENNGKIGALDKKGNTIFPCLYDKIFYNSDDKYFDVTLNGKVGALDNKGKEIFPCIYDKIHLHDDPAYYELKYNGKVGIFCLNKKKILDYKYTDVNWWQTKDNIGCQVKQGEKVGFITKDGKELIPCAYDEIQYFPETEKDRYGVVIKNRKEGLYDVKTQKEVIPCKYDDIEGYSKTGEYEFVIVKNNKAYGIYDITKNTEALPTIYSYITWWNSPKIVEICKGGIYIPPYFNDKNEYVGDLFEENGKWGCFDLANSRSIVPCEYDYIEPAGENLFFYNIGGKLNKPTKKPIGGLWGIFDSNGKILFNAEYSEIEDFKNGVAKAVKDGVASILVNPNAGTKLLLANGINACSIDKNIPKVNRQNDETFAFIFANENYKNCPGANFSINDGKVFEKYCNQTLGIPEINIKYYEDATFGNIQSALKKIQDIADVYDGDAKIIFYYSGLGNTVEGERYILPSDASLASVKTTGISVNNLLQILNTLNTKYTLALFDAPFNGTDKSGKLLEAARGVRVKSKAPNLTGKTIAVFGCSDDKNNYCDKDNGHGLLTYNFLEQIQKTKGESSIKTLIDNAISNVGKQSLKLFNDIQKPQLVVSEPMNNKWQALKF